jgi:hypothetical protein
MPGNIIQATPTDVMPAKLSRAFHMEVHLEADLNMYPDGTSDRNPLAQNDRHYFTMQQVLLPDDWQALRSFFYNHQGVPFYFYNLRETVPPFSWDPSGQNTVGRYTVVFDGGFDETYTHERAQMTAGVFKGFGATVALGLREVT